MLALYYCYLFSLASFNSEHKYLNFEISKRLTHNNRNEK